MAWTSFVFFKCLGGTSAGCAGQAVHSSTMSSISKPGAGFVFLQCLGDTCAGYAGQAMYLPNVANIFRPGQAWYSSNVWVALLLDVLERLSKFCKRKKQRKRRNSLGAQGTLQV